MKLIILDRDGVINYDSKNYIKSPEEWHPLPASIEAIALLCRAGFKVIVATNQSGLGRGLYDEATLEKIHQKMADYLAAHDARIDNIYFCPHTPDDNCKCRKPMPGLLKKIAEDYQHDLSNTFFIGDSQRDLYAAIAANAKPLLVLTGNGKKAQQDLDPNLNIPIAYNLQEAVEKIVLPHYA